VQRVHFDDFDGHQFERLVFAYFLRTDNWINLEWYGQTGSDLGIDIWGLRERDDCPQGQNVCIQCANRKSLPFTKVKNDLEKILNSKKGKPDVFLLVAGGSVSAKLRDKVKKLCDQKQIGTHEILSGPEFEEKLRAKAETLLKRFTEGEVFPDSPSDLLSYAQSSPISPDKESFANKNYTIKRPDQFNNAPKPLKEWVGRQDLLANLNNDWMSPECWGASLIGYGGEGKSSLACRWIDDLIKGELESRPDGVFWWGFYERPSVDEFFEKAHSFICGSETSIITDTSIAARVEDILARLDAGRYIFILDGFEVLQFQAGEEDQHYGRIQNYDVHDFLIKFCHPGHRSFCLITSRVPIIGIDDNSNFKRHDVTRLTTIDGRNLLKKLGAINPDSKLDEFVNDWGGHALTLRLISTFLTEDFKVKSSLNIPPPSSDISKYEKVHRILRRYNDFLQDSEKAFLIIFSIFRSPVSESAFQAVFRKKPAILINEPLTLIGNKDFDVLIKRLISYRIINFDSKSGLYTTHPLVREFYFKQFLNVESDQQKRIHTLIAKYYLKKAGNTPENPKMEDLKPILEAVHHTCCSGQYDKAYMLMRTRVDQDKKEQLTRVLQAYEAAVSALTDFFPNRNYDIGPCLNNRYQKSNLLSDLGFCLMILGRLEAAGPLFTRAVEIDENYQSSPFSETLYNLAELYMCRGELSLMEDVVNKISISQAFDDMTINDKYAISYYQGRLFHLTGRLDDATSALARMEDFEGDLDNEAKYFRGLVGAFYAEHLFRKGDIEKAKKIANHHLFSIGEANNWPDVWISLYRILGEIDAFIDNDESARKYFDLALRRAREISQKDVHIETLTSRGIWHAKKGHQVEARRDIGDLFEYTKDAGYRIYEVNRQIGQAWCYISSSENDFALKHAIIAKNMSEQMNYYWGLLWADEIINALQKV